MARFKEILIFFKNEGMQRWKTLGPFFQIEVVQKILKLKLAFQIQYSWKKKNIFQK